MKNSNVYSVRTCGIGLMLLLMLAATAVLAEGNIDANVRFSWSENSGWQNWRPVDFGGVTVVRNGADGFLSGFAWGENIGWVKLGVGNGPYANTGAGNYGVNLDATGNLSGYAWSETCGWVNFCPTNSQVASRVTLTGLSLDGYAWAENVGYVHFKSTSPAYNVRIMYLGTTISIR